MIIKGIDMISVFIYKKSNIIKVLFSFIIIIQIITFNGCVSNEKGNVFSLQEAIEQSAKKISTDLPKGSRVAIVAFDTENNNLSDYIMEELTGALFDLSIEVADRQNLEYVYKELNFQLSGYISDESARSIGKFLAADLIITGALNNIGNSYRYRASAINVEQAVRSSVTRFEVRNDGTIRRLIASLGSQKNISKTNKYGVTEETQPKTAGSFFDRGILFASKREFDKAISDFTEALKLNPNLSSAYLLRGRGYYANASKNIHYIGSDFIGVGVTHTNNELLSREKIILYEKAISDYNEALKLDPNNYIIYAERGRAYESKREYNKAIEDFTHAIKINSNSPTIYNDLGNTFSKTGEYDMAIANLNQAIKLDSKSPTLYNNRGMVYSRMGSIDKAITDYTQAIQLDQEYTLAYFNRGFAYINKGNYDRAIADYTQVIKLNPNDGAAYHYLGSLYYLKNNIDNAITNFTKSISIDPNHAIVYIDRGRAYLDKTDYDKAIYDYTQAIHLEANDPETYFSRGIAYLGKNNNVQAINDFSQAIRLAPVFFEPFYFRGLLYANIGEFDSAITDLTQALKINPGHESARIMLEEVKHRQGR